MKSLHITLLASIAGLSLAKTPEALVYNFGTHAQSISTLEATLSPPSARLFLAQQLGLSPYHNLADTDDTSISILNEASKHQQPLFGSSSNGVGKRKVVIFVEGIHNPDLFLEDMKDLNTALRPSFTISNPPPPANNADLTKDLLKQDAYSRKMSGSCDPKIAKNFKSNSISGGISATGKAPCFISKPASTAYSSKLAIEELNILDHEGLAAFDLAYGRDSDGTALLDSTMIFQVQSLEAIARRDGQASPAYLEAVSTLKTKLKKFLDRANEIDTTILIMPMTHKHTKARTTPYGVYEVPGSHLEARNGPKEAPLPPSKIAAQQAQTSANPSATRSADIRTTMPTCYSGESICQSSTNNCSGHGSCSLKYKDPVKDEKETPKECWSCQCTASVTRDANNRTKSIIWSGPACQKKDVSAPFLLLAGFTVALVAAVTWGIGLLYSIGQEPLPSVIGAGVSGPSARK